MQGCVHLHVYLCAYVGLSFHPAFSMTESNSGRSLLADNPFLCRVVVLYLSKATSDIGGIKIPRAAPVIIFWRFHDLWNHSNVSRINTRTTQVCLGCLRITSLGRNNRLKKCWDKITPWQNENPMIQKDWKQVCFEAADEVVVLLVVYFL